MDRIIEERAAEFIRAADSALAKLSPKGKALLAAIDTGLLPETEKGWDDEPFNRFWYRFSQDLGYDLNEYLNQREPVLNPDAEKKRERRYKNAQYRNLVIKSLLTFLFGLALGVLLKL